MNELKVSIQKELDEQNLPQAKVLIECYKKEYPADMDVIAMETIYELYSGNLDSALQHALEGVRKYPTSADLYYNLGNVYESRAEWFWAWFSYGRAYMIYTYERDDKREKFGLLDLMKHCRGLYEASPETEQYEDFEEILRTAFGLFDISFRDSKQLILGKYFWESVLEKRYAGVFWDYFELSGNTHKDVIHTKGEFLQVTEGQNFEVASEGSEVLLPIAVENDNTFHKMVCGEESYSICQKYSKHFNYYRIPSDSKIYSSGKAYYGKPIFLHQEADKKRLVLNIFLDGLSQCILDGEGFEQIMPHTARFFKEGTVCERTYTSAEWTYPSIASYVMGLDTTHHMLFHNEIDGAMPKEYPTLAEYFQEKGYFTSMMNGDWRIIPTYGHARGYDQFIYQHLWTGFRTERMVGEVIDHLEAFKETNQFLWMTIGDLHDVADDLDMPTSVQSGLSVKNRTIEEVGPTSVKQGYSPNKRIMYERMAARIDVLLNIIYQYIENHYKNEEILISLFADHGQGYLIPPGGHFCSEGRSKVAFMFRGGKVKKQCCKEVISTSDYIRIMCSLADIEMKDIKIDGVLPKAFGGSGREYALTESIHPGDPYNAAMYTDDNIFYFHNPSPVQNDGRFYLEEYKTKLTDLRGNPVDDADMYEKYLAIILEHIAPLRIYD